MELRKMAKKYEYYNLEAHRDNDVVEFRVRGASHTQHIWNETHIDGLAESAVNKIRGLKQAGYRIYTVINGRMVMIVN
jgi:hypothetical protein